MKAQLIFSMLFFFISLVNAAPTCSKNGTMVFYTNGVTTPRDKAQEALDLIESYNLNSQIDQAPTKVSYQLAYNFTESMSRDFLEAAVQRFPARYLRELGVRNPYEAYQPYLNGAMSGPAYSNEVSAIADKLLSLVDVWVSDYFNNVEYQKTVTEIKGHYEKAFLDGQRIFAISHSQGGLFMRDAFSLLSYLDKQKYFSGFQVATPINGAMAENFGHATHSKDRLINTVRSLFGALPANVEAPLIVNNGYEGMSDYVIDFVINHGMVTTYLHDATIKSQVVSKMVETAQKLESNCTSVGVYRPQDEGSARIVNHLEPGEIVSNLIDFDLMTLGMDSETKSNLRFRLLVEPSENEDETAGAEYIKASLSNGMNLNLWPGNGIFPSDSLLDFELNLSSVNPKIFLDLQNNGSEYEVPIYTTVVPEIKKQICYSALSGMPAGTKLRVVFMNSDQGNLAGRNFSVFTEVPVGTCKDIYLAYNTGYFFELFVQVANPEAVGYLGNWSQEQYDNTGNGWVYNYKVFDSMPVNLSAKLVELTACPECNPPIPEKDRIYKIDLIWQNLSPHSILVY